MQTTEHDEEPVTLPDPQSHPLPAVPLAREKEDESDDPDQIFLRAVTEIDTQPLPRKSDPFTLGEVLEICLLVGTLCVSFMGIVWQCLAYPHTLVVLSTKALPAHITTTLALPTRTVAPVTLTRSATIATTGTGHQDAKAATGHVSFYNGSYVSQAINAGTVFTGGNGVQVALVQSVTIPAAIPPQFGEATVPATATHPGAAGNIPAYEITLALSNVLTVKNRTAFTGGRDARTNRAVAAQDLETVTTTVNDTLTHALATAFPLQPGEVAIPTPCHATTTANHRVGDEATSVTVNTVKTCSAVAYRQDELTREATTAFAHTKPAANYHIAGSVQASIQSVSTLSVAISGKWVYTFSPAYQQLLAQQIAGDTPTQARRVLLRTGVISYASIPSSLPPEAMYINFLVLVA
ncbi:MAG TPA: baseplate J/gp47 family protein [Ktedonobacteraceae bacterium]